MHEDKGPSFYLVCEDFPFYQVAFQSAIERNSAA
jgi:hypothetical protein